MKTDQKRKVLRSEKATQANPSSITLDAKGKRQESQKRLNDQERRVDALALRADERRDKLRKAAGRCK